jgi:sugar phosphate isomerase/epimerase
LKAGLSSLYLMREPFTALVKEIGRSGIRNWELVDEGLHSLNRRRLRTLKSLKDSLGLELALHGPLGDTNIASFSRTIRAAVLKRLLRSLEFAAELGVEVWIFHPGSLSELAGLYRHQEWGLQEESIGRIVEAARELRVAIGIENMPAGPARYLLVRVDQFVRFYQSPVTRKVGLVLDVGHAHTAHQVAEFVEQLGPHIVHIHAHDNDTSFDRHRAIGDGTIDWELVLSGLRRAGFNGMLAVESMREPVESVHWLEQKIARL